MSKEADAKFENLRRQGALNEYSEAVIDRLFANENFFDPTDLVQVKYEMLRRVAVEGVSIGEAAEALGLSRRTFYDAKAGFEQCGVAGLLSTDHAPNMPTSIPDLPEPQHETQSLKFADDYLRIDLERRIVRAGEKDVHLTRTEFELLEHLLSSAGKPLPHKKLEQLIWGRRCANRRAALRVYVNQLRKKIEPDPFNPSYIVTDPLVGYRFTVAQ